MKLYIQRTNETYQDGYFELHPSFIDEEFTSIEDAFEYLTFNDNDKIEYLNNRIHVESVDFGHIIFMVE